MPTHSAMEMLRLCRPSSTSTDTMVTSPGIRYITIWWPQDTAVKPPPTTHTYTHIHARVREGGGGGRHRSRGGGVDAEMGSSTAYPEEGPREVQRPDVVAAQGRHQPRHHRAAAQPAIYRTSPDGE